MTRPTRIMPAFPIVLGGLGGTVGTPEGSPQPVDCCADPADIPDRAASSNGAYAVRLTAADIAFVQSKTVSDSLNAPTVTLDAAPSVGNLLVLWHTARAGKTPLAPSGWTAHPLGTVDAGVDKAAMFWKISDGTETATVTQLSAGDRNVATIAEFAGTFSLDDDNEATGSSASITTGSVTPTASEPALVVGGAAIQTGDSANSVTPDAGYIEVADTMESGFHPVHWLVYRIISSASGSYDPSGTSTASAAFGGQTLDWKGIEPVWNIPAPLSIDSDDATYDADITGADVLRIDLGAAFEIASVRLYIATATAGSRTYTLSGANEPDFSDVVADIFSMTFTAIGSNTPQEVVAAMVPIAAYRYWQLSGPDESRRIYSIEMKEATLATNHQHTLDSLSDVSVPSPGDGNVLTYDSYEGQWVAASPGGSESDPVFDQFGAPTTAFEFDSTSLTGLDALGSATTEDSNTTVPGHLYLKKAATASVALTGRLATPPSAPYTAITKLTHHGLYEVNFHRLGGLGIAEASPGKVEAIHIVENTGSFVSLVNYTNPTTFNAVIGTDIKSPYVVPLYYAIIVHSSTDVDYLYSLNGWIWTRRTAGRNPGFTIGRIGMMVDPESASFPAVGAFDYLRIWSSALTFLGV